MFSLKKKNFDIEWILIVPGSSNFCKPTAYRLFVSFFNITQSTDAKRISTKSEYIRTFQKKFSSQLSKLEVKKINHGKIGGL